MINMMDEIIAAKRLMSLAIRVANHLGHIPTDQPDYNPMRDEDVLQFMENANMTEIQAESQQFHWLDELDREL